MLHTLTSLPNPRKARSMLAISSSRASRSKNVHARNGLSMLANCENKSSVGSGSGCRSAIRERIGLGLSLCVYRWLHTSLKKAQNTTPYKQVISPSPEVPSLLNFCKCLKNGIAFGCELASFLHPLDIHPAIYPRKWPAKLRAPYNVKKAN